MECQIVLVPLAAGTALSRLALSDISCVAIPSPFFNSFRIQICLLVHLYFSLLIMEMGQLWFQKKDSTSVPNYS
jgi:hypothetical protein